MGKGCVLMRGRLFVSGGDGLRELYLPEGREGMRVRLEGAGPVCACGGALYCACPQERMIWRLDAKCLVPTGLFAGGPGMRALLISPDGKRLYVLCADADSLLMLDGETGAPLALNRVGVNPGAMAMDESGSVLAVAGGECAQTVLLCARTLDVLASLPVEGVAVDVAIGGGAVYTLCLTEALSSALSVHLPGRTRRMLFLRGTPGALSVCGEGLLAATEGRLQVIAPKGTGVLGGYAAPGRAARLLCMQGERLLLDEWSGTLFREAGRQWFPVMRDAQALTTA